MRVRGFRDSEIGGARPAPAAEFTNEHSFDFCGRSIPFLHYYFAIVAGYSDCKAPAIWPLALD